MAATTERPLSETIYDFLSRYYRDEVGELAQRYPNEQRSLFIDYGDVYRFDDDLADDWLRKPDEIRVHAEEALRQVDLPADVKLSNAHVRLRGLDDLDTFYPGEFSKTERHEKLPYMEVIGQVAKTTEERPKMVEAAFECQRCGTMTYIEQQGTADDFQEPHECQGCERQGPFRINFDQSKFIDFQKIRLTEPPERTHGGEGSTIDVHVEDDLTDQVTAGDRVSVTGTLRLTQQQRNNQKRATFEAYIDGESIEIREATFEDIEIDDEDEEAIQELANGERGDLFELARESIAPELTGEKMENIKTALFLSLIGGDSVEIGGGGRARGDNHTLLIGGPATGKSTLLNHVAAISPKSVMASGKGASKAGMTAAAVRDDFAAGDQWTLDAGALVQADQGVACIDEIDKVPEDVVSSMHRAMSDQQIAVNKAGINAELPTRTTVVAAGNPKYGRWNDYKDLASQIELSDTLMSRFGLIFRLTDRPEEERDREHGRHMVAMKEAAKAREAGEVNEFDVDVDPAIDHDLLRKFIAYAKRQPAPRMRADSETLEDMVESFVTLRGANGYDDDAPVPVTKRKLEDIHRLAEASARARLSAWIEEEDVRRAQRLVGESLRDYGQNEEGQFDADIVESGMSRPQAERLEIIYEIIEEQESGSKGASIDKVTELAQNEGIDEEHVEGAIEKLKRKGELLQRGGHGTIRTT